MLTPVDSAQAEILIHSAIPEFNTKLLAMSGHALRPTANFAFSETIDVGRRVLSIGHDLADENVLRDLGPRPPLAIYMSPKLDRPAHAAAVFLNLWPAHCAREDWQKAEAAGAKLVSHEDFLASGLSLLEFTTQALGDLLLRARPTYLRVDAFRGPFALSPAEFWPLFTTLLHRLDVRVLELAAAPLELSVELAHIFLHGPKP